MGVKTYQQRQAIAREKIKEFKCAVPDMSGIYLFEREDENGISYFYAGQARSLKSRILGHMIGFEHIDNSLRKRGIYSEENPHGWDLSVRFCSVEELDIMEQYYILEMMKNGAQSLNKTYGSQGKGKTATDNTVQKNYRQGVDYGQNKAIKAIAVYFDKYLDVSMKSGGKLQERKLAEFLELLNGSEKSNSCDET